MTSASKHVSSGILFSQSGRDTLETENTGTTSAWLNLAFAGLFLFTFLLYARPQEMFPELFGQIPLVICIKRPRSLAAGMRFNNKGSIAESFNPKSVVTAQR